MVKTITVHVPASSGNIGPGYDVLGMALGFGNKLRVRVLSSKSAKPFFSIMGEGAETLPQNSKNIIYQAMNSVAKALGRKLPTLDITCWNRIPLARGLGSSAAAVLSGVLAANKIFGNKLSQAEILTLATKFEGHPDNVAPALLGGIQASTSIEGDVVTAPWPTPKVGLVVAIPKFHLSTKKARAVVPKKISMKDAVSNLSSVALLQNAFTKDLSLLELILNDKWHEPYRAKLIPGFKQVKEAALRAGALGVTLSGAGPTMLSFTRRPQASRVASAMHRAFKKKGIKNRIMKLGIDHKGAVVR